MSETRDERVAKLEARLQDGFQKIGAALANGVNVDNWHAHWIELLREYEQINDEIAAHHAETGPVSQAAMAGMPVVEREVA